MHTRRVFFSSIAALLSAALLFLGTGIATAQTWVGATSGSSFDTAHAWNQNANWSPATFPNAVGASASLTADFSSSPVVFLNQNITIGALTFSDTVSPGLTTISISSGSGTNTLTFDNTGSTHATLSSANNSSVIGNQVAIADDLDVTGTVSLNNTVTETTAGRKITKLGSSGSLALFGNNSFSGGISHQGGVIDMGGFGAGGAAATVLGSGPFTFENAAGASGGNTLELAASFSKTFANDFVQNNASPNTAGQIAQISYQQGNVAGYRTLTFDGTFSTGAAYHANQSLNLVANQGTTATNEGTFFFNGAWNSYFGIGTAAIRVAQGSVVLSTASSAGSGGYSIQGNSPQVAAKLVFAGFLGNQVEFAGAANTLRNSLGARNAVGSAQLGGALLVTDTDGGNVFSQTSGATLEIPGLVSGAGALRINDSYTMTLADGVNALQTPTGTVALNLPTGNTNTGGVEVVAGTLLANSGSGSATGTGAVTVGLVSGAISGQSGSIAGLTSAPTRVITNFNTATAAGLQLGQSIGGSGIPAGSIITGITLGNGGSNSMIVIDKGATVTTTANDLAFGAFTSTAALGGTGIIAPTGANGLTVNPGSAINLVNGAAGGTNDLDIDLAGTGSATFASGAKFKLELGAPGVSDVIDFAGLADASTVTFNSNVIDFTNLGGLATGTYTLFTFDAASDYTGTLAIGTGLEAFTGSSFIYNASNIQLLVAVPEPGIAISLFSGLGVLLGFNRRRQEAVSARHPRRRWAYPYLEFEKYKMVLAEFNLADGETSSLPPRHG
jgi:hypothetical protein